MLDHDKIYNQLFAARVSLLTAPEGTGKSQIVLKLLEKHHKVIFLTETNDQATEKAANFAKQGLDPQLIKSRSKKLKDIGLSPKFADYSAFFNTGSVDEAKTKKCIEAFAGPLQVDSIWEATKSDQMDFSRSLIVATRHQITQLLGFDNDDWFVIFDDMNAKSLKKFAFIEGKGNPRLPKNTRRKMIRVDKNQDGYLFAIRPDEFKINHNLNLRQIFTTSEIVISKLIETHFDAYRIQVDCDPVKDSSVKLIGTFATRKKQGDFIMPVMAANLRRKGHQVLCIGDSMNKMCPTHVAVKGNNSLTENHLIVSIDKLPQEVVFDYRAEFDINSDIDPDKAVQLELDMMSDMARQSGSRSGWNRWDGRTETYILCDKAFVKRLSQTIGYPHQLYMNEKEARDAAKNSNSPVFEEIADFLKDPVTYVTRTIPKSRHFEAIRSFKDESWFSESLSGFRDDLHKHLIEVKTKTAKHDEDKQVLEKLHRLVNDINGLLNQGLLN